MGPETVSNQVEAGGSLFVAVLHVQHVIGHVVSCSAHLKVVTFRNQLSSKPVLAFDLRVEGGAADVLVLTMRKVIMAATWAATTRTLLAAWAYAV